jgi:hypothetical protein
VCKKRKGEDPEEKVLLATEADPERAATDLTKAPPSRVCNRTKTPKRKRGKDERGMKENACCVNHFCLSKPKSKYNIMDLCSKTP